MDDRWEVRTPLRYGSNHSYHPDEAAARAVAATVAHEQYDGAALTILTRNKTVYIDHDD